jgi:hypothetical protein
MQKYIINIYEKNHYYVIVSDTFEDSNLYDKIDEYQLSKTNEGTCKLIPVISSNMGLNLSRTIIFIQPRDNILIIFETPSIFIFLSFLL